MSLPWQRSHLPGVRSEGWRWHEDPVIDDRLSAADRAVLALARALANLSDKSAGERAATALGLSLVTSSDVALRPLLPAFGSTLDDDGEAGDGMALAPPPEPGRGARGSALAMAEGASALLGSMLSSASSSSLSNVLKGGNALGSAPRAPTPQHMTPAAAAAMARAASANQEAHYLQSRSAVAGAGNHHLSGHFLGDDGGVSTDSDELSVALGGSVTYGTSVVNEGSGDGANGVKGGAARQVEFGAGLVDAAAAAMTRVAKAASATAAAATAATVGPAAPAGRVVAHAANAASAAVANVAKLTSQVLPQAPGGEPSSSWLVADDPWAGVRYIVVAAGGELRRAAPRDLTFDLMTFESYGLGAKVNRRLYAEATALYGRFMPLVMDFLEAHPEGHVCFGGEGVGGGLAVLLQLMAVNRGLRFTRLLPAVALAAPPVLAQVPRVERGARGPTGREQQLAMDQDQLEDVLEELMSRSILEELGLPQDAVRNLVMAPTRQVQTQGRLAQQPLALLPAPRPASAQRGAEAPAPMQVMSASRRDVAVPSETQLFRLVGRVVQVETAAHVSDRVAAAAAAATRNRAVGGDGAALTMMSADGMDETDVMAAPPAAVPAGGGGSGGGAKRLDVATVSSIAGAAAAAAAFAAAQQVRNVGAGALRAASIGRSTATAAAAAAATAAGSAASAGRGAVTAAAAYAASAGRGVATVVAASAGSTGKGAVTAAAASATPSVGRRAVSKSAPAPAVAAAARHSVAASATRVELGTGGSEVDGDEDASAWGV